MPGERVDAVQLAGLGQTIDGGGTLSAGTRTGEEYSVPAANPRVWGSLLEVKGGRLIAVDQDGRPALVANTVGTGKTLLSAYPIETCLANAPSAFEKPENTHRICAEQHCARRALSPGLDRPADDGKPVSGALGCRRPRRLDDCRGLRGQRHQGAKGRGERPGFDRLLRSVLRREIDVVMAWSVDRLGRSLQDLVAFLGELRAVGCDLYLHQQGVDTTTPAGRALFQMLGVFAEFERAIIQERVRAGIARARAEGKHLGRPYINGETERAIRAALAAGKGIRRVARECGVGTSVVQRIKAERRPSGDPAPDA